MKGSVANFNKALLLTVLVAGLASLAPTAMAATAPVTVSVAVTGTPAFGATVTAKATVTINDGSTLQSIAWSQVKGAAATLADTETDTVSVTLGARAAYRNYLVEVLGEAPIEEEEEGETFVGGLQNRFQVVAINPLAEEHAGATVLDIAVTTTSGTYHTEYDLVTSLPWPWAAGIRDVPAGLPVILHAKTQASYNWALAKPTGSTAALADPTTQSPEFTPDMPGIYTVTVTDLAKNVPVTLTVYAGLWKGIITGQDVNGRPTADPQCIQCHTAVPEFDKFTPWAQTGHAEIFTQNINTPNGHYTTACVNCHTVGYDTRASNNGIDDQPDWAAFASSGLLTHGDPNNWTNTIAQYPDIARMGNIQCENCHGPQNTQAHYKGDGSRTNLSSDVCGACHGEPARHGRFQQWQLSGHANFDVARAEGTNSGCAKCHSAQGFIQWLNSPNADDQTKAQINVTWTADDVQPQTCATCHDPHAIGTTSGGPTTNATVRISGDTPMLDSGFKATNLGRGAICATCHNSRRGLRNDSTWTGADSSRAPHVPSQADILMGQNLYFVETGIRSNHSLIEDACVTCHMEKTPPPAELSYQLGGTNHSFVARADICSKCHSTITTESVQGEVETRLETLQAAMGKGILDLMTAQTQLGKKITLSTLKTITDTSIIDSITLADASGRQAITVTFKDGSPAVGPVAMNNVKAVAPNGSSAELYTLGPSALPKAGWNYLMIETDESLGVHNPTFVKGALDLSIYAVQNAVIGGGTGGNTGNNGGPGGGYGAVGCTTPYVYWAEIATHAPGANESQWRTDMVARNLSSSTATLKLILHTATGDFNTTGTIAAGAQNAFEDVVKAMGQSNAKGSMEVCSTQPLLVLGRIFNVASAGTFGQFLDGHVANLGLKEGDLASLIGLRQQTGSYRTNVSVTNGGTIAASIEVKLYDNAGTELTTYTLDIPAGQVVQDLTPFATRANKPDLGWGFATLKVIAGFNINASASVIDAGSNDPVTIPAKM